MMMLCDGMDTWVLGILLNSDRNCVGDRSNIWFVGYWRLQAGLMGAFDEVSKRSVRSETTMRKKLA